MALQSDAIESRLEGLKIDARRTAFDSHLRAIRSDGVPAEPVGDRAAKPTKRVEAADPIDRVVSLLEELSRRIDGLEKKDRALADEIRRRARQDRRRRSICVASGLVTAGSLAASWFLGWL